jgi:hypothetical protein
MDKTVWFTVIPSNVSILIFQFVIVVVNTICNGRIFTDKTIGRNTCKDSSLVDYLIVHPGMFDFISYFKVEDFNPDFTLLYESLVILN